MINRDTTHAWAYHEATKHSYRSIRENTHRLDWRNYPLPFKIYPELTAVPLPDAEISGKAALWAASQTGTEAAGLARPDRSSLASLLYFTGGITRRRAYPGGEILFRAASCTGALYEVEIYVCCAELPGLAAGLYQFTPSEPSPEQPGLKLLREGDWRGVVARATADEPSIARAPVHLLFTCTYWRNAWKYQARTYRHFGWDTGTMLANLLAEAASLEVPARIVMGFVDSDVNGLLGLDTGREVSFSLAAIGLEEDRAPAPPEAIPPLDLKTAPLSRREIDYPEMRAMHAGSSLATHDEAAQWRAAAVPQSPATPRQMTGGDMIPLRPLSDSQLPLDTVEEVIRRRGSTRQFAREPIRFEQFSTLLDRATRGISADFLQPGGAQWNDLYVIVNAVEGLEPGAYFHRRETGALESLKLGDFRKEAGYLGLEQEIPADCSAAIFFLADLKPLLERYGNRAYRCAQIEAGIIGGKLYLGAYALRLGASGLTFYDDDVTRFFSPHAEGKSAIFLVALGKRASRR